MPASSGGQSPAYQQLKLPHRQADRSAMIEWARAMISNADVVYLDTETTGFPPRAEIVDIAVIDNSGAVLVDTLVSPRAPIPSSASRVHGIYDRDVVSAPVWNEVLVELTRVVLDRTIIVYNADFDREVIYTSSRALGLEPPRAIWECAMTAYGSFVGEASTSRTGEYRWFKLDEAARACGFPPGGHRALGDSEACRQVVHAMANTTS